MNRPLSLRSTVALLLAASVAGVHGCGSVIESRSTGGAPGTIQQRDAAFEIPSASYNNLGYRMDWRGFPRVEPRESIARLQIFPDALVVQETGSNVTVMEPANGSVRWSSGLANRLTKFVGVSRVNDPRHGDAFVVASESEAFLLATQTGTLIARQQFEKVATAGPVIMGGMGIFGTASGEIFCHQFANGIKLWGVDSDGSFDQSPVVVSGSTVGAVTTTGRVVFVDLAAGGLVGKGQIFGGPGAALASNGAALYVASVDQSLYAFLPNGAQLWRYRTSLPLKSAPAATAEAVYCETQDGITAFDAMSGSVLWSRAGVSGAVIGKRKTNLMVWDARSMTMTLVDQQRGDVMANEKLPGVRLIKLSAFEDGDMYVVSTSGVVAKFVTR